MTDMACTMQVAANEEMTVKIHSSITGVNQPDSWNSVGSDTTAGPVMLEIIKQSPPNRPIVFSPNPSLGFFLGSSGTGPSQMDLIPAMKPGMVEELLRSC